MFASQSGGLRAHIEPTQLGFEVNDSGEIQIVANNISFFNRAGMTEAFVTGYQVDIVNADGDPYPGLERPIYNLDGLGGRVPAGFVCPDAESSSCPLQGVPQEVQSEPIPFILVHAGVPVEMLLNGDYMMDAVITFYAERGRTAFTFQTSISVTYPVDLE